MNIFALSKDPVKAAAYHCDRHVIKMVTEYSQLLSSAHKVLDGAERTVIRPNGKHVRAWVHPDKVIDSTLCFTSVRGHVLHPCAIWARKSKANYLWLYQLYEALSHEFVVRYGKAHSSYVTKHTILANPPHNIPDGILTQPPQAMPIERRIPNKPIQAYRNFYRVEKRYFVTWKTRRPEWYDKGIRSFVWFDKYRVHRYRLERRVYGPKGKTICVIMVNPSIANETDNDQTITKLEGFADHNGWGRIIVGNLFSYIATDVKELASIDKPSGPENNRLLLGMMSEADIILVAWGSSNKLPPKLRDRYKFVVEAAKSLNKPMYCLGTCKDGHPKHPLMIGYDVKPTVWKPIDT